MLHLDTTEDLLHHQTGSHTVADLKARTKAALQAGHLIKKALLQKAGHTPADHQATAVLEIRKALHRKANHTLAGQPVMTARQEVLVTAKDQAKKEVLRQKANHLI